MDKLGSRAIIGVGVKFSGTITGARAIEINGSVIADLSADKVTIGSSGVFEGSIRANLAVISGEYDGAMEAGSVWATKTARISGSVQYKTLQMDRGAALNCHVVHNWVVESKDQQEYTKEDFDHSLPNSEIKTVEIDQDPKNKTSQQNEKLLDKKKGG
ncbi:polymer-forming cytoskeletal protein [Candidatus Puniceispirillum sp.]|nr:polymer-forming cytoskeletal protein [Candidatus Puniceispirillum sp.]